MANEDYKNGKLVEIVREFNNTGNQYEVNGIEQAIAVPFWRRENDKFQVIPKGSYSFINEAGNDYLKILDSTILQQATQFQIVYDYLQLSSKYIEDFPDVVVLTEKYNQLVDDTTNLFSYLKSVGLVADTLQMTKVLSALEPLTTWYMDEKGEIRTLPVSELYGKFQQLIDTLHKEIKKLLDIDLKVLSDKLKKQLAEHVLILTNELNKHKTELNDYTQEKIKEIQATCERLIDLAFNKLTKADTILELQSRKNLEVGDVVEVLGYYSAGDGAGHKRIIANEDDGSGVQLSNKLWANVIHNGEVNVSWFGAKGDSIADDTIFLKKANLYCAKFKICLFIDKDLYLLNKVEIDCNVESNYNTIWCNYSSTEVREFFITLTSSVYLKKIKIDSKYKYKNCGVLINKACSLENVEVCHFYKGLVLHYWLIRIENCKIYSNKTNVALWTENFITSENNGISICNSDLYSSTGGIAINIGDEEFGSSIPENECGGVTVNILNCCCDQGSIIVNKQANVCIQGVHMEDNEGKNNYGIKTNVVSNIQISNCYITGSKIAISIQDTNKSVITNNYLRNTIVGIEIGYYNRKKAVSGVDINTNIFFNVKEQISIPLDYYKNISFNGEKLNNIKSNSFSEINYPNKTVVDKTVNYKVLEDRGITREQSFSVNATTTNEQNKLSIVNIEELLKLKSGERIKVGQKYTYITFIDYLNKNVYLDEKLNEYISGQEVLIETVKTTYIVNGICSTSDLEKISNKNLKICSGSHLFNNKYEIGNWDIVLWKDNLWEKRIFVIPNQVQQLNTLYHMEKMKQEGVYNDYISYMDEKTVYDKQQRKLEQDRQLAYEEALKENPNLTYEEFMSVQPMTLNLVEEPQPSEALKKFMEKYL